ncbi:MULTISPECIES: energy transducer TonB [unclassified Luteimonas]|uniref:energy transducer TonB n=1 Tax=unclassified Luteimonas TaxID=2629088 RepID=UPI0015FF9936|nr:MULTISPECIES: energy transducer TonB [unclassified Luteimonas]MBB1472132.1 TonB family protein [Luteimonas sp. MC1782]MBB6599141.1 TonB family protein [Luteimonas sp. MC1825]QOC89264.1 TonB family protein [Luteimonas sp. MC1825]
MVLQPVVPGHDAARPDPGRIAGISGTLLLNAAAFLLLLAPMTRPLEVPRAEAPPVVVLVPDRPRPPDPPPVRVEVVRPQPTVRAPAPLQRIQAAATPAAVVVEHGSIAVDPQPAIDPGDTVAAQPGQGPVTGMRLEYGDASAPPYPRDALRDGAEGTVMLQVLVGVDGRPLEVTIHAGSGHRRLDEAARRHVLRHWRFRPALRGGEPVQALGLVPIAFSLDRG